MVFYNTIYWRRASDGLQPPKLSRDERQQNRPVRDLAKIRPRANPRARLDAVEHGTPDVSVPLIVGSAPRQVSVEPGTVGEAMRQAEQNTTVESPDPSRIKKKKRRRIRQHMEKGFLGRWFGGA